jgi:hypothetical protein
LLKLDEGGGNDLDLGGVAFYTELRGEVGSDVDLQ